jgi:glutamyl/glutaminyl-tRNA synthetase
MPPRVRFAPSPTGYLHVGGARTALFNWLFARRYGGVFVLRIEDTDAERSSVEMVEGILDGMRWLGLDWDEGPLIGGPHAPYFQSQRFDRHRAAAARLVADGHAYYCYCTPDELKARREAAEQASGGWKYDRACAALAPREIAAREKAGLPRAIRFRVPEGMAARFDDLVHGPIEFDAAHIEDFVTASRPTTSPSSATMWRWGSRTWCAGTITCRTRRSTSCCIRRSARPCRRSRTCR